MRDTYKNNIGVEMMAQLILSVEKTVSERQLLSLIIKDK